MASSCHKRRLHQVASYLLHTKHPLMPPQVQLVDRMPSWRWRSSVCVLSVGLSVCLLVCLSVCLSVGLSVCLSVKLLEFLNHLNQNRYGASSRAVGRLKTPGSTSPTTTTPHPTPHPVAHHTRTNHPHPWQRKFIQLILLQYIKAKLGTEEEEERRRVI